ncbi:hypothetical protein PInf_004613 [Phytophthora infestans]|nr:hypothetical protein PInf_004613 [Phytophthora infestans]
MKANPTLIHMILNTTKADDLVDEEKRLGPTKAEAEQVRYHEGGDLHAGDLTKRRAVIPEVSLTTEEVTIDDIQVDPGANDPAEADRLRQIWESRHTEEEEEEKEATSAATSSESSEPESDRFGSQSSESASGSELGDLFAYLFSSDFGSAPADCQ